MRAKLAFYQRLNPKYMLNAIKNYFIGSFQEMKKVAWPTKSQTMNYSIMVIALSVGMAVLFGILDYMFNWGITNLFLK